MTVNHSRERTLPRFPLEGNWDDDSLLFLKRSESELFLMIVLLHLKQNETILRLNLRRMCPCIMTIQGFKEWLFLPVLRPVGLGNEDALNEEGEASSVRSMACLIHWLEGFFPTDEEVLALLRLSPAIRFGFIDCLIERQSSLFVFFKNPFDVFHGLFIGPIPPHNSTKTLQLRGLYKDWTEGYYNNPFLTRLSVSRFSESWVRTWDESFENFLSKKVWVSSHEGKIE